MSEISISVDTTSNKQQSSNCKYSKTLWLNKPDSTDASDFQNHFQNHTIQYRSTHVQKQANFMPRKTKRTTIAANITSIISINPVYQHTSKLGNYCRGGSRVYWVNELIRALYCHFHLYSLVRIISYQFEISRNKRIYIFLLLVNLQNLQQEK